MRRQLISLIALAVASAASSGCSRHPLAVLSMKSGGPTVATVATQQAAPLDVTDAAATIQLRYPLSGLVTAPG